MHWHLLIVGFLAGCGAAAFTMPHMTSSQPGKNQLEKREVDGDSPAGTDDIDKLKNHMEWYRRNLCGRCMRLCMEKKQEVGSCELDCSETLYRLASDIGVAFAAQFLIQDGYIASYECKEADIAVQLDPAFVSESQSDNSEEIGTNRPGTDNGGMFFSLRGPATYVQGRPTSNARSFNLMQGVQGVVRQAAKYLGSPSRPPGNLAGTGGALRGIRGRL